jgi:hypothetical protein
MNNELTKAFKEFKNLILQKKYFEAHEILEEIWHPMRKSLHPDRDIIRGFINAAVALELKKRDKKNYLKVWKTYEKHKTKIKNNKQYKELSIFLDNYQKDFL